MWTNDLGGNPPRPTANPFQAGRQVAGPRVRLQPGEMTPFEIEVDGATEDEVMAALGDRVAFSEFVREHARIARVQGGVLTGIAADDEEKEEPRIAFPPFSFGTAAAQVHGP